MSFGWHVVPEQIDFVVVLLGVMLTMLLLWFATAKFQALALAGAMGSVNVWVAVLSAESVTCTVKVRLPDMVGVPVSAPFEASERPACVTVPAVTVKL